MPVLERPRPAAGDIWRLRATGETFLVRAVRRDQMIGGVVGWAHGTWLAKRAAVCRHGDVSLAGAGVVHLGLFEEDQLDRIS